MRVLLRYKEPVCLLLSFAAILLVVTVYGLTHGFDSSATVDHKSPQILQELLPVDEQKGYQTYDYRNNKKCRQYLQGACQWL